MPGPAEHSPPPFKARRSRILPAIIAIALLCLAGIAAAGILRHREGQRLLATEADTILTQPALVKTAERIGATPYTTHCAACHGDAMQGDPRRGAPDLTDGDWLYGEGRVSEVEQTILYGIRSGLPNTRDLADMPAFATVRPYARYAVPPLAPADIRDVVAFLGNKVGHPEDVAAIARGRDIYAHRGGCFDCHGEDAGGDPAIGAPNLADDVHLYGDGSDAATARSIAHGRGGVCPGWIGRMDAVTIRALAVMVAARSREPRSLQ